MKRLTLLSGLALLSTSALAVTQDTSISLELEQAITKTQELNATSVKVQLNLAPTLNTCVLTANDDSTLPDQGIFCPVPAEAADHLSYIQYLDTGRYKLKLSQSMDDGYTITPTGNSGANYSEVSLTFNVSTVNKTPDSFILECSKNNGYVDDCAGSVLIAGSISSSDAFNKQLEVNTHLANVEQNVQSIASSVAQGVADSGDATTLQAAFADATAKALTAESNAIAQAASKDATLKSELESSVDTKLAAQKSVLQQEIHAGDWATIARVDNGDAANAAAIDSLTATVSSKASLAALDEKADISYVDSEIAKLPAALPSIDNCYDPGYRIVKRSGEELCERDPLAPIALINFNGANCPNAICVINSGYGISKITVHKGRYYKAYLEKPLPNTSYILNGVSAWGGRSYDGVILSQDNAAYPRNINYITFYTTLPGGRSKKSNNISITVFHPDAK